MQGFRNDVTSLYKSGTVKAAGRILDVAVQHNLHLFFDVCFSLLQTCSKKRVITEGRHIHAHIMKVASSPSTSVSNALISMYVKCGSVLEACYVFERMPVRDVSTWTTMISGYAKFEEGYYAIRIFNGMQQDGLMPNQVTYLSVITACTNAGLLVSGKYVHAQIIKADLQAYVFVSTALVGMYSKCGSMENAWSVFDRMLVRDVVAWNLLISACDDISEGTMLFWHMQQDSLKPDNITYLTMLGVYSRSEAIECGKLLHAHALKGGQDLNMHLGSALIDMYAKCGDLEIACPIFDRMPTRNVVSWNVIIFHYAHIKSRNKALRIFEQMHHHGITPDIVTYISMLNACEHSGRGKHIHAHFMKSHLQLNIILGSTLVDMYCKCGNLKDAFRIFNIVHPKNVVIWNAIISGFTESGAHNQAVGLFRKIALCGYKPDKVTYTTVLSACTSADKSEWGRHVHAHVIKDKWESNNIVGSVLVDMYVKFGQLDDACGVFDRLLEQDVISWSVMISGYAEHGDVGKVFIIFAHIQCKGFQPDTIIYLSVLYACAKAGCLELGKAIHMECNCVWGLMDVALGSSIMNMYAKCGSIGDSFLVFDKLPVKNLIVWNAMMSAFASHGNDIEVLTLLSDMQYHGLRPNWVTFVSILTACSHVGLVNTGCHYFIAMSVVCGIYPMLNHYICMVDLLGRAGCQREAIDLMAMMPVPSNMLILTALLCSCRLYNNMECASYAIAEILKLGTCNL